MIGDSTFLEYRRPICQHLRKAFLFDVRWWVCRSGAWETSLAEDLAISPKTDTTVMCPNGNRMSLHRGPYDEPAWLKPNAANICGGLRETSTHAAVFVGHASLSPGLENKEVYARVTELYVNLFGGLGVPVVTHAPGVELQADDLHWTASSEKAVLEVISTLMENMTPTKEFAVCPPAPLWHWKFDHKKHYPWCKKCDQVASNSHLGGKKHIDRCGSRRSPYEFEGREHFCNYGLVVLGEDLIQITESPLSPDRPLQVLTMAETLDPPEQLA